MLGSSQSPTAAGLWQEFSEGLLTERGEGSVETRSCSSLQEGRDVCAGSESKELTAFD